MAPLSKDWPSTPEIDHFRPVGVTDNIDKKTLLEMVESKYMYMYVYMYA